MIEEIMKQMDKISYGVPNEENKNLMELIDEDEVFNKYYYLQTPEELQKSELGTCWDQVELERYLFEKQKIKIETYWICTYDGDNLPSHTFLTFEKNNKYCWFEHSWIDYRGIHEYNTKEELLNDVLIKFKNSHITSKSAQTLIYLYNKPPFHITCKEYYDFINDKGILYKINE